MRLDVNGVRIPETYEEHEALQRELAERSSNGSVLPIDDVGDGDVASNPLVPNLGALSRVAALERIASRNSAWRVKAS